MRLLVLFISIVFMSIAVANEGAKESEAASGPQYVDMTPKFILNLAEPRKFLVVNVQLLVEGSKPFEAVHKHMPALRHELVMLFSGRPSESLQTTEQREALRQEANAAIAETLKRMEDPTGEHASADEDNPDEHKKEPAKEEEHPPKEEGQPEEGKVEHTEGFKEVFFTEFLVD